MIFLLMLYVTNCTIWRLSLLTASGNVSLSRVHMRNLHPGAKLLPGAILLPGANLHPLASRSYANKLCPYAPRFDLRVNIIKVLSFMEKLAGLECLK